MSIDNVSVKEVGQNWLFQNGWNMGDGVAVYSGTVSAYRTIYQENAVTVSSKYRLTFDIVSISSGSIENISQSSPTSYSTVGTKTEDFIATSTDLFLKPTTDANLTIDNVSIKEVTDDTDLPRIDFTDGTGSLLLEPQRTNLVTYSEDFSQWIKSNSSVNTNLIQSPSGFLDADKIIENTNNSTHYVLPIVNNVPSSGIATLSVFAKKGENNWIKLVQYTNYANFDLENGVIGNSSAISSSIINYGNGWYKCIMNFNVAGSGANFDFKLGENNTSSWNDTYTGDGTSGVYLWGAQVEEGSYATSYIPTESASVTRSADVANNSGNADLFNDSEGVLYAEIAALANDGTNRQISISDGTATNRIYFGFRTNDNEFILSSRDSTYVIDTVSDITNFNKYAFQYKSGSFKVFVNGLQYDLDADGGLLPTNINELSFDNGAGTQNFYGDIKCIAVFKEALSNDLLERLTGEGYESFRLLAEANNYTII
jgi:hypothetical protein